MNAIQGDTVHEILLLLGESFFNILLKSPGELFLEMQRGSDLTGLKWDGPWWPGTTKNHQSKWISWNLQFHKDLWGS